MKKLVASILIICFFYNETILSQNLNCVNPTPIAHDILIPSGIPKLDGNPLPNGSIIVGVFSSGDTVRCSNNINWAGSNTILKLFGREGSDPGFAPNELIKYRVILPNGTQIEHANILVNYSQGGANFEGSGQSFLSRFDVSSPIQAILTVSPNSLNVGASSGSNTTVNITSNISWTATSNQSWLTVSPSSGNNNQNLTLNYQQNTNTQSRIATVTVSGTSVPAQTVTVTQAGAAAVLSVNPTTFNVGATSGSSSASISSNIAWSASSNAGWLTVSPTNGNNNGTVTLNYQQNTSTQGRTATVTVSGTGVPNRTITVTQAGAAAVLTVNTNNINVSPTPGSAGFSITSNINWTVSENANWFSISPPSGSNNGSVSINYDQNMITQNRSAQIIVSGNGVQNQVVTITQAGATATLTVSPNILNISANTGSTSFSIASNISWNVSENANWISITPASGSNNGSVIINYDQNTSMQVRSAVITITGSGVPNRTVTVNQQGSPSAVQEVKDGKLFQIYPNPAVDNLNIEILSDSEAIKRVQLIDLLGKNVFQNTYAQKTKLVKLDISYLSSSVYQVLITTDKAQYIKKIVVK